MTASSNLSVSQWVLKPWCDQNGLELIATKVEMKNSIVTGNFLTKNCYGVEKAYRVKTSYILNNYDHIYAYGDSSSDIELLELADESLYKPFRDE